MLSVPTYMISWKKVLHKLQLVKYALKCSEQNLCQKFITGKCFRSACLPFQCSHCLPVHIGWCLVNTHFTSHHWIGKSIISCVSCFIWICTNGEAVIIAALHFYMYVFVLFVYVFGLYFFFHLYLHTHIPWDVYCCVTEKMRSI